MMSISLKQLMMSEVKLISSSLFLIIINWMSEMSSSMIQILIIRELWSDRKHCSGKIEWLSSSKELDHKNMRSITKFEFSPLSAYLVGTGWTGWEKDRLKELAMSKSKLL